MIQADLERRKKKMKKCNIIRRKSLVQIREVLIISYHLTYTTGSVIYVTGIYVFTRQARAQLPVHHFPNTHRPWL